MLLDNIIYLKSTKHILHQLPLGTTIYSTEPGNRFRQGKHLFHDMGNLLRHTCYAQTLISQPLSSASALRDHTSGTLANNFKTLVLLIIVTLFLGTQAARRAKAEKRLWLGPL